MAEPVVTRFHPTLHSGPLHLGHVLNFLINILYARKHGGRCYVTPETANLTMPLLAQWFGQNLSLIGDLRWTEGGTTMSLFLDQNDNSLHSIYFFCALAHLGLTKEKPEDFIENPGLCSKIMFNIEELNAINDAILGVNVVIRGREWDVQSKHGSSHTNFMLTRHAGFLNEIRRLNGKGPIKLFHHPLLLKDDKKISKSELSRVAWGGGEEENKTYTLFNLLENKAGSNRKLKSMEGRLKPVSPFFYFISEFMGKLPSLEEFLNYHEIFDEKKVFGMDDIVMDFDKLNSVDKYVRSLGDPDWIYIQFLERKVMIDMPPIL